MSRAQQAQTFDTASSESQTNEAAAQASEAVVQADISQNQSQLAKFAAENPYVQGGQEQTLVNQQESNTADATAAAAAAKNQQQAQRTGQNAAAPIAAGEAEQQAAQRALSSGEAGATQSRLASGATYGEDVLKGGQAIAGEEANLASIQAGQAQGELSIQEQAAQTPSFLDELGQGLISGAGQVGSAYVLSH